MLPKPPFAWTLGPARREFSNAWITVEAYDATDPNGRPAEYALVRFANLAVGVLPYAEGHVWLVGQSRVPFESYSWEIPAGGGDKADAVGAAHRELLEETGLRAQNMEPILRLQMSNSVTDEEAVIFLATGLSAGEQALESSEDITVLRLPLAEALDHIARGEIVDSLTVAGLHKLELMRLKGELPNV